MMLKTEAKSLTACYCYHIYTVQGWAQTTQQRIFPFDLELKQSPDPETAQDEHTKANCKIGKGNLFFWGVPSFSCAKIWHRAAVGGWTRARERIGYFSAAAGWGGGSPWRRPPPSAAPSPRTSGPPAAHRAPATTCRSPTPPPRGLRRPSYQPRPRRPPARSLLRANATIPPSQCQSFTCSKDRLTDRHGGLPWRGAGAEKKSSGRKPSTSASSRSSSASSRPSAPYSRSQRSRKAGEAETRRHHSGEKSSTSCCSGVCIRPRYRTPEGTKGSAQGFSLPPPLPLTTAIGFLPVFLLLHALALLAAAAVLPVSRVVWGRWGR